MVHIITANELKKLVYEVFTKLGIPSEDSEVIADSLVNANLRGVDSHGLSRGLNFIDGIKAGDIKVKPDVKIVKETDISILYDGDRGIGIPIAYKATMKAIEKAKSFGIGIGAARNLWNVGMLAYYVMKISSERMIGISFANTRARISIPGVKSAMTGTNPLAIALPTEEDPIVLDMAMSIVALGKIVLAARKKEKIPEGWAINKEGKITTDPDEALKGFVLPMGGYKGLGLAEIIDIICSALTGAPFGLQITTVAPYTQGGFFVIALQTELFRDYDEYIDSVRQYIKSLKSLPRDEGIEILLPGEPELRIYKERVSKGIPIDDETWETFVGIAKELCVSI